MRQSPRGAVGRRVALETGKAHFGGLCTCASVWACPVCSAIIRSRRAEEVRDAIEAHGADRTMMLSLTARHGLGHELKTVRKGVAGSFRRLTRGVPWKRFAREYGLTGVIRRLDLTYGPENGWHPHIHALLLFDASLSELQMREAHRWIAKRWAACVARCYRPRCLMAVRSGQVPMPRSYHAPSCDTAQPGVATSVKREARAASRPATWHDLLHGRQSCHEASRCSVRDADGGPTTGHLIASKLEATMSDDLKNLLEQARSVPLTPTDAEAQRRSFAFGNTHFENADITRAIVDQAAESLSREHGKKD